MSIKNKIKNNIKPFLIGLIIPVLFGIIYAFTVKHSVPCIWCNQPVEEKTCMEMYYGHQNVIHLKSKTGKLCFAEMCEALSVLGGSFKDFSPSSQIKIERTYYNLEEFKD